MQYLKRIIVIGVVILVWGYVGIQYIGFWETKIPLGVFLQDTVLNPQKVLFNNLLGVMTYIYVKTKEINRVEYVIRCRDRILLEQSILGIKVCITYSVVLLVSILLPACGKLIFSTDSFLLIINVFIRLFWINYCCYSLFLVSTIFLKRILAFFCIIGVGLLILVLWLTVSYYWGIEEMIFVEYMEVSIGIIIVAQIGSYFKLKTKEYY